jgi:2-oxoacid:acceptor oxidoreductase delta subunit (pyruvate/2-ketoisovalerate family)
MNRDCILEYEPGLTERGEGREVQSRCLRNRTCEACDICRLLCPDLAITRDDYTGEIIVDLAFCKGCGICAFVCPKGAITMVVEEEA